MMRIISSTLVATITTVTLTACGSADDPTTTSTIDSAIAADADVDAITETTDPAKAAKELDKTPPPHELNSRGNIVKALGEVAGVLDEDGATLAEWTIDAIEVDGTCTSEWAENPELGHFLILTMSVSTSSGLAEADYGLTTVDVDPNDFTVIGPDGISENTNSTAATYSCLEEAELLPYDIGPGENVVGNVVLDTAHTSGILTYRPWWTHTGGWEWEF